MNPDQPAFNHGELVWHKTDSSRCGVVTAIVLRQTGYTYLVYWRAEGESEHSAIELTADQTAAAKPPDS